MAKAGRPGAQRIAEAVGAELARLDRAARAIGAQLVAIRPGHAEFAMTVRDDMVNGHGICHGGFVFALADTAFAYACNAHNRRAVAQSCTITFLAPAREGDALTARCEEVALAGRSGIYDSTVTDRKGRTIAVFRGQSRRIGGAIVAPGPDPDGAGEGS